MVRECGTALKCTCMSGCVRIKSKPSRKRLAFSPQASAVYPSQAVLGGLNQWIASGQLASLLAFYSSSYVPVSLSLWLFPEGQLTTERAANLMSYRIGCRGILATICRTWSKLLPVMV